MAHRLPVVTLKRIFALEWSPWNRNSPTPESTKSSTMTVNEEAMTARVVAVPTPSEPPCAPRPAKPLTMGMAAP